MVQQGRFAEIALKQVPEALARPASLHDDSHVAFFFFALLGHGWPQRRPQALLTVFLAVRGAGNQTDERSSHDHSGSYICLVPGLTGQVTNIPISLPSSSRFHLSPCPHSQSPLKESLLQDGVRRRPVGVGSCHPSKDRTTRGLCGSVLVQAFSCHCGSFYIPLPHCHVPASTPHPCFVIGKLQRCPLQDLSLMQPPRLLPAGV